MQAIQLSVNGNHITNLSHKQLRLDVIVTTLCRNKNLYNIYGKMYDIVNKLLFIVQII